MMFSTGPRTSGMPIVEGADGDPEAALALVLRLMGRGSVILTRDDPAA